LNFFGNFFIGLKWFFYEIFYFLTIRPYIIVSTDRTLFPPRPCFGSFSDTIPLAMGHVLLGLGVHSEGLVLCHHMGTRVLDPSSVLDFWLPAENMFSLDFYCAERG
jgi:hypothetical protein